MDTPPANWNSKAKQALNTHLWLILSLVANFFLVIFLYIATQPLEVPTVPPSTFDNGLIIKTNVVVRHETFSWDQLESTNYVAFIKNLHAVGCPEQTIRDIIMAEVNRWYARRRLEEVNYPNYQWWRSDPDPALVKAATARLEALETERRGVLTSLLGPGWDAQSNEQIAAAGGITLTGPILGDLAPELKEAVYAIAARAQLKIEAYQAAQRDQNKAVDPMELVRLREEPLMQLVGVLNPAQYEEYVLRYSPAAQELREQMRSLQLTQDEFRDLFNAVNSINGQPVFYYNGNDSALLTQQQQLRAQSDAIIKATLGDQLYAAYQLNQDPLYRSSKALAAQLGVPDASIMSIYEINRATQAELDRIRKDPNLSDDEKVEALSQTQVEQQQSLQQILGPEAFERWLQTHTTLR
ncbi:MAG: hypothetical protein ACLQU4_14090 [Limisphaerales bacterium]